MTSWFTDSFLFGVTILVAILQSATSKGPPHLDHEKKTWQAIFPNSVGTKENEGRGDTTKKLSYCSVNIISRTEKTSTLKPIQERLFNPFILLLLKHDLYFKTVTFCYEYFFNISIIVCCSLTFVTLVNSTICENCFNTYEGELTEKQLGQLNDTLNDFKIGNITNLNATDNENVEQQTNGPNIDFEKFVGCWSQN